MAWQPASPFKPKPKPKPRITSPYITPGNRTTPVAPTRTPTNLYNQYPLY